MDNNNYYFITIYENRYTLTLCTSCMAAENSAENVILTMQIDNPIMTVNDTEKKIDDGRGTTPVIANDRTLFPIRTIIEKMGGTVSREKSTQTATPNYNSDKIDLVIVSTTAYLNGAANTLDVFSIGFMRFANS